MKHICLIIFLLAFILLFIFLCFRNEKFQGALRRTVIGGTTTLLFDFGTHTGIVRRLLGDNGKTIILLHNSPFDVQVWIPLYMYVQSLKRKGEKIPTLISYDLLGHGTAWQPVDPRFNNDDTTNYPWTIKKYSDDLKKIYDSYVTGGQIIIAGFGFGAFVGMQFSFDFPDLIEHLYILNAPIGPVQTGISDEITYFVNWISQTSPQITFLTLEKSFVQKNLCIWFENRDPLVCPYAHNARDKFDTFDTVEYLIGAKLMRESSATTNLQITKLSTNLDFRQQLADKNFKFPITQLIANNDVYTPVNQIKNDFNNFLSKSAHNAKLYIVEGKHGFVLIFPQYITELLSGKDMSSDPQTVDSLP